MPQARCPKCRADIVCLGISADGPVVGGGGHPDPLLMRLVNEILPLKGDEIATNPPHHIDWQRGPPPSVTHRQPVRIEDMQTTLRQIVTHLDSDTSHVYNNQDVTTIFAQRTKPWTVPIGRRQMWTDAMVTTTTLVVDDTEAESLPSFLSPVCSVPELDRTLGWSRRLRWSPDLTARVLFALTKRLPSSATVPEWSGEWFSSPSTLDHRGVLFVRIVIGSLVALERWCQSYPTDNNARSLRVAIMEL